MAREAGPNWTPSNYRKTCIAISAILVATSVRTCATLATSPSPVDKWLYPDVNTLPTYNYLDIVNASWTSNFVAPYLLLNCRHPNDVVHYAYPYNHSVTASGFTLVPLDDGNAWVCHFEVSDLSTSSAYPLTFTSNNFNVVLDEGRQPVLWTNSQGGGGEVAASSATSNRANATPRTSTISMSSTMGSSSTHTTITPLSTSASTRAATPTSSSSSFSSSSSTSSTTTTTTSASASNPTLAPSSIAPTPSNASSDGLSKSQKVAIIVGTTAGALLLLVIAVAGLFILRTRRSDRNVVVYRSGPGGKGGYGSTEVAAVEAPRER